MMNVLLLMHRIDVGLRPVALDSNPGWIPWAQWMARLEFAPEALEDM